AWENGERRNAALSISGSRRSSTNSPRPVSRRASSVRSTRAPIHFPLMRPDLFRFALGGREAAWGFACGLLPPVNRAQINPEQIDQPPDRMIDHFVQGFWPRVERRHDGRNHGADLRSL